MVYLPALKPLGTVTIVDDTDGRYTARINEEIEVKGGHRIRLNVFLPRTEGPWPVLMGSSPYGKDVPYRECKAYAQGAADVPEEQSGKHLRFESASPSFWCPRGYAVVYWDERGTSQSPGVLQNFAGSHFDDYCELIAWAADQSWSNGKVGLTGISYFGMNQWPTAARKPRGLACICPWEGASELYRDAFRHGGMVQTGLWRRWFHRQVMPIQYGSRNRDQGLFGPISPEGEFTEEQLAENRQDIDNIMADPANEFIDDGFYDDRMTHDNLGNVEIPVLTAGNWGGINLHLRGNVLGFLRVSSKYKYLRIHTGRHDLPYFFHPHLDTMASFFDCFLKGDDHGGWKTGKEPPVKYAIRRGSAPMGTLDESTTFEWRSENEWPLARTRYEKWNLHADQTLSATTPTEAGKLSYKAGLSGGELQFTTIPATEEYEICGHLTAKVSVSLSDHKGEAPADIDVFAALRKLDKDGNQVWFTASTGDPTPVCFGWIRASHRVLDPKPYPDLKEGALPFPVLSHKRKDRKAVKNGEVYDLEFELWPTNLVVEKGERLVFEISAKDPEGSSWFTCDDPLDRKEQKLGGMNHIHIDSENDNYVVLPIV